MDSRVQEISRFEAIDKNGKRYTIIESARQSPMSAMGGETQWVNQSTYFRALGYGPAGQISDSEFEIFLARERVKRV